MNFEEYDELSKRTVNPDLDRNERILNWALGLAGEMGELVDPIKKHFFHKKPVDVVKLMLEAGDLLYYLNALVREFGYTLEQVAEMNVDKLRARHPRGFQTEIDVEVVNRGQL